ncbi:hypothetical protein [Alsobacter metallidurans]|nr:hypothetical protein [Alsobacter metallidurans]
MVSADVRARLAVRFALAVMMGGAALASFGSQAHAQAAASDCASIGPLLQQRGALLQRATNFAKKKPTAAEACSVFTSLAANGAKVLPWLKTNADWCQVPPQVTETITQQSAQVNKAKANACQAAAMQKKMEAQAKRGGGGPQAPGLFGGGDDVVGGPIKMPQGAL